MAVKITKRDVLAFLTGIFSIGAVSHFLLYMRGASISPLGIDVGVTGQLYLGIASVVGAAVLIALLIKSK